LLTNESDDSPVPDGSNDIRSLSRPMPEIVAPVACWRRDNAPADFGKLHGEFSPAGKMDHANVLSWWPPQHHEIRTGKPARKIKQYFQLTHDLGVAETFLRFRETRPEEATLWKGEGIISPLRRKKKVPDAIIAGDAIWPPRLVVEFAGVYARERIEVFHWFCEKEQLAYELW
jgi:hypothetical protein